MINNVAGGADFFTQGTVRATMDKQAYEMMGFPLNKDFKNMVHIMLIYNLPITPDVVTASKTIYGTNLHLLK